MENHLKASLDGDALEKCFALILGDYSPAFSAEALKSLIDGGIASDKVRKMLHGARTLFMAAASLDSLDDLGTSLELIARAKRLIVDVTLLWLNYVVYTGPKCDCYARWKDRIEAIR